MSDVDIEVRSNIDHLSARAVHDCLVDLVRVEAEGGETFLKVLVPKKTFELEHHAGHVGPFDDGIDITASVGIPAIDKPSESGFNDPSSVRYPIFVDQGTGIFGDTENPIFAKKNDFMKLPPDGINSIFHKEVKGQEGKHFMAGTYGLMKAMLEINSIKFKDELKIKLKADKLL